MGTEPTQKLENAPVVASDKGLVSIFGGHAIEIASEYATKLADIIDKQHLYTVVNDKRFTHVEGWTTLGAMVGVFPEVVRLERLDKESPKMIKGYLVEIEKYNKYQKKNETFEKFIKVAQYNKKKMKIIKDEEGNEIREIEEIKYLAEVVLVVLSSGARLGRAIALCSNLEEGKLFNQEYSIASMAQTRATGKAYRLPFSWVMTLAGYQPTPFEDREVHIIGSEEEPEVKEAEVINPQAKPAEEKQTEPKAEAKPKEQVKPPEIPKEPEARKKLWGILLENAKKLGVDLKAVMKAQGVTPPPKMPDLEKLIPAVSKAITEKENDLERPVD